MAQPHGMRPPRGSEDVFILEVLLQMTGYGAGIQDDYGTTCRSFFVPGTRCLAPYPGARHVSVAQRDQRAWNRRRVR